MVAIRIDVGSDDNDGVLEYGNRPNGLQTAMVAHQIRPFDRSHRGWSSYGMMLVGKLSPGLDNGDGGGTYANGVLDPFGATRRRPSALVCD